MSIEVENLEHNMANITVEVPAEQFDEAMKTSYNKNKNRFNVPGFRKGKAPMALVLQMYGPGSLYDDAIDIVLNATYPEAADESSLEIVSRPEITIKQVGEGQPFIYVAAVAVKPPVTLGEYKGIEVERARPEVTEADIDAEVDRQREENARLITIEDRPVQEGDQTLIDFAGSIDGVPFEGGTAEDYPLVIGSHSFIDGFEDQIVGMDLGEERDINVTFPENYGVEELAGKPAVFHVKVKEIQYKELPEADDEFAGEVSEFDTMDEYRDDIRKKLTAEKEAQATGENEDRVVAKVVENAEVDIPGPMIDMQVDRMINDYNANMQSQGLTLDMYLQYTGQTLEDLKEDSRPAAENRLRTRLVLEAVADAENIKATDEEVDEELQRMADQYKLELDKVKEIMGEEGIDQLKSDIAIQDAVDFLVAEANLV